MAEDNEDGVVDEVGKRQYAWEGGEGPQEVGRERRKGGKLEGEVYAPLEALVCHEEDQVSDRDAACGVGIISYILQQNIIYRNNLY